MDSAEMIIQKVRQRRLALQQSIADQESSFIDVESSRSPPHRSKSSWVEEIPSEDPAETVVELANEGHSSTVVKEQEEKRKRKQKGVRKPPSDYTTDIEVHLEKIREKLAREEAEQTDVVVHRAEDDDKSSHHSGAGDTQDGKEVWSLESKAHGSIEDSSFPFGGSIQGSRATTPRSDQTISEAYRERIRSRIQKAKEKAEIQSVSKTYTKEQLRKLEDKKSITKVVEEEVDEEEKEIQAHLKKRSEIQARWKSSLATASQSIESKNISSEDAYDFFTRVWEDEPDVPSPLSSRERTSSPLLQSPSTSVHPKIIVEHEDGIQIEDESVHLLDQDFTRTGQQWFITKKSKTHYVPYRSKREVEEQIYFVPSSKPVPVEHKIRKDCQPRNLEEEGLYVGKRPPVVSRNLNKVENRLLKQQAFHWFGDDGRLKMLPDPIRISSSRPPTTEDKDSLLECVYRKAVIDPKEWSPNEDFSTNERHQLDLDIASLSFHHHPLFSKEHVLASHLSQMCQEHAIHMQKNLITVLTQRLQALRSAVTSLKQTLSQEPSDSQSDIVSEREQRLHHYQQEIRQIRKLRDTRESEARNLLKNIINIWREIKNTRVSQGYSSTPVKITIHKEEVDKTLDQQHWDQDLEAELNEEEEDYMVHYEQLMKKYNTEQDEWKSWHKAKKMAAKREKMRAKLARKGAAESTSASHEDFELTAEDDKLILEQEEPPKPQSPERFNRTDAYETLKRKSLAIRRIPGEPHLYIELTNATSITPTSQCPRAEQQRRSEVSRQKYNFKIFYNEKEVAETSTRVLNQDFTVTWGQIFNIQISQWPRIVKLQIFESGSFSNSLVAEICLPVPEISITSSNTHLVDHEFSCEHISSFKHAAVGSGLQFEAGGDINWWLVTNGLVKYSLAWGIGEDGKIMAPSKETSSSLFQNSQKSSYSLSNIPSKGLSDIEKLREWINKSHLDPNDPDNATLFQAIQQHDLEGSGTDSESNTNYFRLEPLQAEFDFVSMEELESNLRFRLLCLRNRDVPEFRNYNLIPADEKEIPQDILEHMSKKPTPEAKKDTKKSAVESLEGHRERATKLLHKIRERVVMQFHAARRQRVLEDVVVEDQVPNIGTLGFGLLSLLQHRRPLYPMRKERKKVTGQSVISTEVKIIITVMHAMNVPVRSDSDTLKEKNQRKEMFEDLTVYESQVHPFVEVMFQREAVRTHVAEGPHPTWNQELHLPFKAPNDDYSSSSLETVKDAIYFNLFDEIVVDLLEDDRERETTVHERLERRWLGNLKIPFTTLYLNSKIEGTFRVNVPSVLLSYEHESRPWLAEGVSSDTSNQHTYLSFFITIEPCLQLPDVFREKHESDEPDRILHEVERWQNSLAIRYPQRFIKTMAVDISGKWVFIPRFLRPLKPPEELLAIGENSPEIMELLARFVSLIPTVSDSVIYPGLCDIWSTCDQFLQILAGDEEEHAILLCNFFLYLGKKTMLLLGAGIPEGPTAYVLTWESNGDILMWNAITGNSFSVRDSYSPLQRVGCLIDSTNIWANIQKNDHSSRMNFDLSKGNDWKSFFSRSSSDQEIISIQPESLVYPVTDSQFVHQLQEKIESTVKESIMRWRRRFRTSWNRYCIQTLRKILPKLERNAGRTASLDSLQELEKILSSYKMNGFPLTMPYTDIDTITEAVFATGVHLTEEKDIEFALAVHIYPYPCTVLAVWIYVATLSRRR